MFTFNFKKLPKGFLLALSMIFLFEAGNVVFDDFFCRTYFDDLRLKANNEFSRNPKNDFDILILGDSYNTIGIIPEIIKNQTGLSAYNFSVYIQQTVLGSYCMAKNYLKHCSRKPRYLIMGHIIANCSLTKDDIEKESISFLYSLKNRNMSIFIKEFGLARSINFLIPSVKHQWFYKKLFLDPLSLNIPSKGQIDNFVRQLYINKGHYVWRDGSGEDAFVKTYDSEAEEGTLWDNRFKASLFYKKYIKAILELAQENNVQVIYLIPSLPPDWYRICKKYGDIERYDEFCDWIKAEYPGTLVLNPQRILDKKDMYSDPRHLNKKGALLLTEFLSRELKGLNLK